MIEIINEPRLVKARKRHRDQTREFIMEDWKSLRENIEPDEIGLIEKAISENWMIEVGEIYEMGVFKYDDIYVFRNKIGLGDICLKYDLFPED